MSTVIASNSQPEMTDKVLTILHFNDVYNIEPRVREPVGGAARFTTAVRQLSHLQPLILFSGDAFNPSMMSTVTKGKQMVPILNGIGVNCAVFGNHDFDFGVDTLSSLAEETTFPWLMSNVYDMTTERPLADGLVSQIITWNGIKVGLVGLVEEEWIDTLATIDPQDVECLDFVEEGQNLAKELRQNGAEFVVALTHMRWPNDIRLAENVPEIDLILGGHDHDFTIKQVCGKYVIKSGTDFRNMSQITINFRSDGSTDVNVKEIVIDSSFEEDSETKKTVSEFLELVGSKMEAVIGELEVELDGRFSKIRTSETNLGNFITDIMLEATDSNVALLNSGTLRSDTIHSKGEFKIKDLMAILPMIDPLVVIQITGHQLLKALENGVSKYPALEGRFPQVAGMSFGFDPTMPAGQRIDPRHVRIQGEFLEGDNTYGLVTKSYLAEGKDGYDVFKQCPVLLNDEDGPALCTAVRNHFQSVQILRGLKKQKSMHRQSIIPVARRKSLSRQITLDDERLSSYSPCASGADTSGAGTHENSPLSDTTTPSITDLRQNKTTDYINNIIHCPVDVNQMALGGRRDSCDTPPMLTVQASRSGSISNPGRSRLMSIRRSSVVTFEMEHSSSALAPSVEGRIFIVNDANRFSLNESWLIAHMQRTTIEEVNETISPSGSFSCSTPTHFAHQSNK